MGNKTSSSSQQPAFNFDNTPPPPPPDDFKTFILSNNQERKFEQDQEIALFAKYYKAKDNNFWICKILNIHRFTSTKKYKPSVIKEVNDKAAATTENNEVINNNKNKKNTSGNNTNESENHEKKDNNKFDQFEDSDVEVQCVPSCGPRDRFEPVPTRINSLWLLRDYGTLYQLGGKATPKDVNKKFESLITDPELKRVWASPPPPPPTTTSSSKNTNSDTDKNDQQNTKKSTGETTTKNKQKQQMQVPQGLFDKGYDVGPSRADLDYLQQQDDWQDIMKDESLRNIQKAQQPDTFDQLCEYFAEGRSSPIGGWTQRSSLEWMMYSVLISEFQATRAEVCCKRDDAMFEYQTEQVNKKYSA